MSVYPEAVLTTYIQALADRRFAAACAVLTPSFRAEVVLRFAAAGGRSGECEDVLRWAVDQVPESAVADARNLKFERVEKSPDATRIWLEGVLDPVLLVREQGEWLVADLGQWLREPPYAGVWNLGARSPFTCWFDRESDRVLAPGGVARLLQWATDSTRAEAPASEGQTSPQLDGFGTVRRLFVATSRGALGWSLACRVGDGATLATVEEDETGVVRMRLPQPIGDVLARLEAEVGPVPIQEAWEEVVPSTTLAVLWCLADAGLRASRPLPCSEAVAALNEVAAAPGLAAGWLRGLVAAGDLVVSDGTIGVGPGLADLGAILEIESHAEIVAITPGADESADRVLFIGPMRSRVIVLPPDELRAPDSVQVVRPTVGMFRASCLRILQGTSDQDQRAYGPAAARWLGDLAELDALTDDDLRDDQDRAWVDVASEDPAPLVVTATLIGREETEQVRWAVWPDGMVETPGGDSTGGVARPADDLIRRIVSFLRLRDMPGPTTGAPVGEPQEMVHLECLFRSGAEVTGGLLSWFVDADGAPWELQGVDDSANADASAAATSGEELLGRFVSYLPGSALWRPAPAGPLPPGTDGSQVLPV